ncbi:WG repeat-containing protein [Paenibacillus massiliensis]|uniref:WG repeat-containing protein n=1 Tax=Paenibacillus massiliensis TaxID=225917 RepID=UPI00146EE545|nr:WG repeat-containing protein [Paenibacillus massiliensis]
MKQDDKYGFIDRLGNYVIEPMYRDANEFSDELAWVSTFKGKKGYINKDNKMVIEVNADYYGNFKFGLAQITINGIDYCIDKNGEVITSKLFKKIHGINENQTIIVEVDRKMGLINYSNEYILHPEWDYIGEFSESFAVVSKDGKDGYISENGNVAIDPIFFSGEGFSEGFAIATLDGKHYGFIDSTGAFVIEPKYYQLKEFSEGFAGFRLKSGGKWGYLNSLGEVVIKPKFQSVEPFYGGLADVVNKDRTGFINQKGKYVIKNVFLTAKSFRDGLAYVNYNGEWGYLDKEGQWIFKPRGFDLW